MKSKIAIELIAALLTFLFVYAAVNKLINIEHFQVSIGKSPLLANHNTWIAWAVPIAELLISIMLTIPRFRILGFYASFTIMIMFTAYIVAILQFSEHIPCSCGGVLEGMGWKEHLVFNSGFVILAGLGVALLEKSAKGQALYITIIKTEK